MIRIPSKHSSWWRRLENVLKTSCKDVSSLVFVFRRCFQDVLIKTNIFALVTRLQRRLRRLGQDQYIRLGHTSWRLLAKTASKRFQDVFKTFWKRLQDILQRCLQDVFKTYHQVKLLLLTDLWEAFNMFLRHTAKMVVYRRICLGHTFEKFMVSVQSLQEW